MLGPLLLGNYMGTSSTQEFTQAEVVHAVYFYPYLSIFLLLNILKDFPCVLKQRRTHLSVQWRYSQKAAGKRFVPVNGMKQIKNSVCMAMGYFNNGVYANETWYAERGNASMSTDYNCAIPTTCQNNVVKKQQVCKGNNELH